MQQEKIQQFNSDDLKKLRDIVIQRLEKPRFNEDHGFCESFASAFDLRDNFSRRGPVCEPHCPFLSEKEEFCDMLTQSGNKKHKMYAKLLLQRIDQILKEVNWYCEFCGQEVYMPKGETPCNCHCGNAFTKAG